MSVPPDFLIGFCCCSMVALLYLLYELVEVWKTLIEILRESFEELREE